MNGRCQRGRVYFSMCWACIPLTSSMALGGQLTSLNCDSSPVKLSNDIAVHAVLLRRLDEAMTQNPLPNATCKVSTE